MVDFNSDTLGKDVYAGADFAVGLPRTQATGKTIQEILDRQDRWQFWLDGNSGLATGQEVIVKEGTGEI